MSLAFDAPDTSDGEILRRVRAGEAAAYGRLYRRHVTAARRVARSLVSAPADADDIVAEVFAATFAAIRRGTGPQEDFLPYVLRSIRRECHRSWRRGGRQTSLDPDLAERTDAPDDFARRDERELLQRAFVALPPRMQTVLWHVEVDGLSHAEIARRTRSTPQAIAQLAVRARRSLGERYLQGHIAATTATALPPRCAATRASLAEVVRGTASARRQRSVTEHLAECAACTDAHEHLRLVNERLRGLTLLALATTVAVPKRWAAGVAIRTGAWLLGSATPLTAAATIVVLATVAPLSAPAASPPSIEPEVVDAAPPVTAARPAVVAETGQESPATDGRNESAQPLEPVAVVPTTAASVNVTTTSAPATPPPAATGDAAAPTVTVARQTAPPPAAAEQPEVAIGVTVDVPPLPLLSLPPLPLVGQLSDSLDIPPVVLDVGVGDAIEAGVGVGDAAFDASIGPDGVDVGIGGSVDVPLLDVPPIVLPPVEVPPIGLPLLGG